jgi:hypothetical protein
VQLDTPNAEGLTDRQSHERYIRNRGADKPEEAARRSKLLEPVDVPAQVSHLLGTFDRLNLKRRWQVVVSLAGAVTLPEPISSLEMEAHLRLHQRQLTPWEVQTIELMDLAFREESAKLRG